MENLNVSVYSFVNYKTFFRTVYEELKFHDSHFSYRTIQKKAGFSDNSNHFWQILEGRRPISKQAAEKYGKVFGLNSREIKYLKLMVEFDLAKNDKDKNKALESMKKCRNFLQKHEDSMLTYEMFSDWYLPIVWEMAGLEDFREDSKWISQKSFYTISTSAVERGIKKLLKMGLLMRENGQLKKTRDNISTDENNTPLNPIIATAYRNYMRESITMSVGAMKQRPVNQRLFAASTLLMSKEEVVSVREKLLEVFQNINKESNKTGKERLYQLNLQYFSLLNLEEEEG